MGGVVLASLGHVRATPTVDQRNGQVAEGRQCFGSTAFSQRTALLATSAGATGAVASQLPRVAHADDLRSVDPAYRFDEYETIVNRDVTIRMVYEWPKWPNLNNPTIYGNISNGLNSFQFSYDLPDDQVQVVVVAYASANLATYDDVVWAKYRLGEVFKVQDPTTGEPATRNIWFASKKAKHLVRQQEAWR
jgi:hypothetical protein